MKKTIALLVMVAGLATVSCKKDRTCECTTTMVSQTSTDPDFVYEPQPSTTTSTKYKKVKKNNVLLETCVSSEDTYTSIQSSYTYTNGVQDYVVTTVSKTDCSIK